jgi:ABC-type transport system involved in cytochrome bd biosynthesis fused ATPase/permease subunit
MNSKGKSIFKLAQDLVARKYGIVPQEKTLDNMTLQQYLDMYKEPLSKEAMGAIVKLTKVAEDKKKMKKDKKDKAKKKKGEAVAMGSKKASKKEKKGMAREHSKPGALSCI